MEAGESLLARDRRERAPRDREPRAGWRSPPNRQVRLRHTRSRRAARRAGRPCRRGPSPRSVQPKAVDRPPSSFGRAPAGCAWSNATIPRTSSNICACERRTFLRLCVSEAENGMVACERRRAQPPRRRAGSAPSTATVRPGMVRVRVHHVGGIRELRQHLRRHEAADFDFTQSARGERRDPGLLLRQRHDALDALQAITRPGPR